ncbi:uncharacterized protein PV09_01030 [Verruconis gallopava]|uniref:Fe2OG dioxygenase domain-containing protein n=1 Tax=Verruconis gallopava TaxID=253628 RepID=A0A0D1Z550_9PEZI|nr:uncharacterized protein PV09_01030 [Verruconis gallopava]KIW08092.1 hypothetical protein PV09_01030 [Verruconis gallopava]
MTFSKGSIPEIPLISLVTSTPEDVLQALSTVGFIHLDLEGTVLRQEDVDRAFEISAIIHSIPMEDRRDSMLDARSNGYRGMIDSLDERSKKPDWKESFGWGRFEAGAGESETTQVLPEALEIYKPEMASFSSKCFDTSLRVLDMLSKALNVLFHPTSFDPSTETQEKTYALVATKWGDITLLFQEQNGQPGLQIYLPTEEVKAQRGLQLIQGDVDLESGLWISAPIIPNTVLVNVGLILEFMTDGICKANVHRVIFPPSAEGELPRNRKSIAYFSTPSFDVEMSQVRPDGTIVKAQESSSVGEFFAERQRLARAS